MNLKIEKGSEIIFTRSNGSKTEATVQSIEGESCQAIYYEKMQRTVKFHEIESVKRKKKESSRHHYNIKFNCFIFFILTLTVCLIFHYTFSKVVF